MVGIGHPNGAYSLITNSYYFGAFDIFSTDGGTTWDAYLCGNVNQFRWKYGATDSDYEDNRIQISTTQDRDKVFIGWNDNRSGGVEDLSVPDIFVRGIDVNMPPTPWYYTENENGDDKATYVTLFSEAMYQSYWMIMSKITLQNNGTYTIPFTYMSGAPPFNINNPATTPVRETIPSTERSK